MGWTVLYIAFGAVALWLLGEVLLQYKARLRWRLLAFFGFGTVVVGVVLLSSVVVIGLGAVAFAVGQTLVTLSYRKGFVAGWALDGLPGLPDLPGLSRRREDGEYEHADDEVEFTGDTEPPREDSDLREQHAFGQQDVEPQAYAPQPLPDETGEYGVYGREENVFAGQPAYQEQYAYQEPQPGYQEQQVGYGQQQEAYAAYSDPYIGYGNGAQPAAASYDAGYGDGSYGGYPGYGDGSYGGYDGTYGGYDPAYAAQPNDPYATAGYPAQGYDQAGYDQQAGYAQNGYPQGGYYDGGGYAGYGDGSQVGYDAGYGGYPAGQDPYAAQPGYGGMPQQPTPAEGVWVPQPREGDDPYQTQTAQGYYPYQDGYEYYTDQRGGY